MYGVKVFEGLVEKIRNNLDLLIENKDWEFRVKDSYNADFSEKLPLGNYELIMPSGVIGEVDTIIASFKLVPMVNCCGICVSTQAFINPQWRHKGLGTFMNSIRLDIARYNGYSLLLCTDIESNEYQRKILAKNGWQDIYKFVNRRTKNTVNITVINL